MTARIRRLLFLESFLGNFLFSICMLFGVSMTSAVSAGVIMAAIPAACALLSWAFLREPDLGPSWARWHAQPPASPAAVASPHAAAPPGTRNCLAGQPAGVRGGGVRGPVCRDRQGR
jgi:hypothetical protein